MAREQQLGPGAASAHAHTGGTRDQALAPSRPFLGSQKEELGHKALPQGRAGAAAHVAGFHKHRGAGAVGLEWFELHRHHRASKESSSKIRSGNECVTRLAPAQGTQRAVPLGWLLPTLPLGRG